MKRVNSVSVASWMIMLILLLSSCAPAAAPTPAPKAGPPSPAAANTPISPAATGTQPAAKPGAPSPSPKPAAQPKNGGILTVGNGGDPPSLDVHQETGAATYAITAAAYNGLAKYDPQAWPEQKVIPDLASSWEVSPDGKIYTFRLAKGVKFQDGSPLTAEDVKFSFDRMRGPKVGLTASPRAQQLAAIDSVDTPDDSTVKITLKYSQASFISLVASFLFGIVPKRVVLDKKDDLTKTVVGTGPFKFKSYSSGVSWELVKNPDYFVPGRPYLDGVKGYIIMDGFTRFAALRTKAILWWSPQPYMSVSQTKVIEEQLSDKIQLAWAFHPAWYGAIFNMSKAPWSDLRVRQAVTLSFDRKRMLTVGLQGAGIIGMSAQPPSEWALPEEEMMKVPGYAKPDIEAAKKLLAEAGVPAGFKTDMLVRGVTAHQDLGVLVKDALAPIGINVDLNVQETAVFNSQRDRKVFSLAVGALGSSNTDPDTLLGDHYVTGSPRNWEGYSNPEYDALYLKQSRSLDAADRKKTVWEMQRILLRDVPIAVAYWAQVPYAWWKEVKGYTPPVSFYNAFGYQDIWIAN